MARYKLVIEYMGRDFCGWQRQPNVPSVQQTIEDAIFKFSGQDVRLTVAGRTDAGVHGMGQVAHVDFAPFKREMSGFDIGKAINAHMRDHAIAVLDVVRVADDFHARFDAVNKLYRYRLINRQSPLTVDSGLAWQVRKPLDLEAMRMGARHLIGKHDFTTFRDSECQAKSPIRTLDRLGITSRTYDDCGGVEIVFEVEGMSFLHHQVRNMVGTLTLVGHGKWSPDDVKTALEHRDRRRGGPTAPSDGLYMVRIDYSHAL